MSEEYPCIYWENRMCRKFSDDESLSFCVEGPCPYETPSNADRIRAMTDNELADLLDSIYEVFEDGGGKIIDGNMLPPGMTLDWLQRPKNGEEAAP